VPGLLRAVDRQSCSNQGPRRWSEDAPKGLPFETASVLYPRIRVLVHQSGIYCLEGGMRGKNHIAEVV